jgi:hypothetical protein
MIIGYVVENHGDACPGPGFIRVISPKHFGFKEGIEGWKDMELKEKLNYCIKSSWIMPLYQSSSDSFVPEVGELVVFERLEGTDNYIWRGALPAIENVVFESMFFSSDNKIEGRNINEEIKPNEYKKRIIGSKSGTNIIIYDSWIKDRKGDKTSKIEINVAGNFAETEQSPSGILIDGLEDKEKIDIFSQNKDADNTQNIILDNEKDKEKIILSGKAGDRSVILDSTNGEEKFTIELKEGFIEIDEVAKSISIEIGDVKYLLDGNEGIFKMETNTASIASTNSGDIDLECVNCNIKADAEIKIGGDSATNGVFFEGTGLTLSGLLTALITHTHPVPQSPVGTQEAIVSPSLAAYAGQPNGWFSNTVKTKM